MKRALLLLACLFVAATPLQTINTNTYEQGIAAGSSHFKDVWARDALYASWGELAAGSTQGAENTLTTLLEHKSEDGQIPLRVGRKNMILVFMGLPSPQGAVYDNDKSSSPALDPNCLFVITEKRYYDATGNRTSSDDELKEIMNWLERQDTDGNTLLNEGTYASWDDAIKKKGESIYSNACYYGALQAAHSLTQETQYLEQAERLRDQINQTLWTGEYYLAWEDMNVLDIPGNLLAAHLNVSTPKQTTQLLQSIKQRKDVRGDLLPKTNYEHYPWTRIYFPFYFVGMDDYHNDGPYWTWVAALEAEVRARHGDASAIEIVDTLHTYIDEQGTIHEVYETPGVPVDRIFYDSEQDFSWTAGLLILAEHAIEDHLLDEARNQFFE